MGYKSDTSVAGTDAGMMTSSFVDLNGEKSFTLDNFSVTGYSAGSWDADWEEWEGGCAPGLFSVQLLNGNGRTIATYYWADLQDSTYTQYAPGWYIYNTESSAYQALDAKTVSLDACAGLWVFGRGMKFVSAGAVVTSDIEFQTVSGTDACGVANGTGVELSLADLTVTGYSAGVYDPDWEEWEGGCAPGLFALQKLNGNGRTIATYYWADLKDANYTQYAPGWYVYNTETSAYEAAEASEIAFESGNGFWVFGRGMTLNIPCFSSKAAAE